MAAFLSYSFFCSMYQKFTIVEDVILVNPYGVLVWFFTEGRPRRSFFRIAREDYKEGLDKAGKTS